MIPNGGGVCRKSYRKDYGQILGYGIPDWSIVAEPEKKSSWIQEAGIWRYYHGDTGEPVRNDWHRDPDLGYGIPDWSIVAEPEKKSSWIQEAGIWRYYHGDTGEPVRNDWHRDPDGRWYWFDGSGVMVANAWKQDRVGKRAGTQRLAPGSRWPVVLV